MNNTYDAKKSRVSIGSHFVKMYGFSDNLTVDGIDKNLLVVHDVYPIGWKGVHLVIDRYPKN